MFLLHKTKSYYIKILAFKESEIWQHWHMLFVVSSLPTDKRTDTKLETAVEEDF